jgi:hypothetical protein
VADGPWWAGEKPGLLDSLSIYITSENVSCSAAFDAAGSLKSVVKADISLAFDWISAIGLCSDRIKENVKRMLGVGGVLDYLASKGITDTDAMMTSIDNWFKWWQDNFYSYLNTYFVPQINFEFTVVIAPGTGWTVTVAPVHDPFPKYDLTLRGRGEGGPTAVYSASPTSVLGPLALIGSGISFPARPTVVGSDAIGDWR